MKYLNGFHELRIRYGDNCRSQVEVANLFNHSQLRNLSGTVSKIPAQFK